jgi:hypothetical protein
VASEQTLLFIEDYRSHSALWDITDKDYTNKLKRTDAYAVLATKYYMIVKGVKDECIIFGQMVASQIRKLNQRNQAIAKNRIQNRLFELEMEEMNTAAQIKTVQCNYLLESLTFPARHLLPHVHYKVLQLVLIHNHPPLKTRIRAFRTFNNIYSLTLIIKHNVY